MRSLSSSIFTRAIALLTAGIFTLTALTPPPCARAQGAAPAASGMEGLDLPAPGTMVAPSVSFTPAMVAGMTVHADNPLQFDFIIDTGNDKLADRDPEPQFRKLIKYFLAALTVPEDELWVNLSPYEQDRIIPEGLGKTEMGRDLLAQDYILKQLSASLFYPEQELGSQFWDRVYEKSYALYGTTDIPMNTFNKIWIVPDRAVLYEHENNVLVLENHLKVMTEQDYIALQESLGVEKYGIERSDQRKRTELCGVTAEVVKEILIPEIEREVNEGRSFANLRQIYNSMLLATWYKRNLQKSLLGQVYVDQNKTKGVDVADKRITRKIYDRYIEAFQKGVYNYIREDFDPQARKVIPRRYFSGGTSGYQNPEISKIVIQRSLPEGRPFVGRGLKISTAMVENLPNEIKPNQVATRTGSSSPVKLGKKIAKSLLITGALATITASSYGYWWLRYGYDMSPEYFLTTPKPQVSVEKKSDGGLLVDGREFSVSPAFARKAKSALDAIANNTADISFWTEFFKGYPEGAPVSHIVTMQIIRELWELGDGRLNNLFDGLRANKNLLYQFLSEIDHEAMDAFSQYFAVLKPGTRQAILTEFRNRLIEEFAIIDNGKIGLSSEYAAFKRQADRMRVLYSKIYQMLNQPNRLREGDVPEGPVEFKSLPEGPTAPFVLLPFSRSQTVEALNTILFDAIRDFEGLKERGYTISFPSPANMNISKVALMIDPYDIDEELLKEDGVNKSWFFEKNQAAKLLQWVVEQTRSSNSRAHRLSEQELLNKAIQLHIDHAGKTVDIYGAIATIGHYYKMAGNDLVAGELLGTTEALSGSDGGNFIWNKHDASLLMWSLHDQANGSVDDQGRPVIHWRNVDAAGNDLIPTGQRTGILRFITQDDFYHSWNVFLMSLYVSSKTSAEIREDINEYRKLDLNAGATRFKRRFYRMLSPRRLIGSEDTHYLPAAYKVLQEWGLDNGAWELFSFSADIDTTGESRIQSVFAQAAKEIGEKIISDESRFVFADRPDYLVDAVTKQTYEGGRQLDDYLDGLMQEWEGVDAQDYQARLRKAVDIFKIISEIRHMDENGRELIRGRIFRGIEGWILRNDIDLRQINLDKESDRIFSGVLHRTESNAMLEKLLQLKDESFNHYIAEKATSPELMEKIAREQPAWVMAGFAYNKNAPLYLLFEGLQKAYREDSINYEYLRMLEYGIKDNYGVVGERIFQIYERWANTVQEERKPVAQEAIDVLREADAAIRAVNEKAPHGAWRESPLSGDLTGDIRDLVEALNKEASSPVSGVADNILTVYKNEDGEVGGINLNPKMLDLEIRRDDRWKPLPVWQQPIRDMHIDGFSPVIINVTPLTTAPLILE